MLTAPVWEISGHRLGGSTPSTAIGVYTTAPTSALAAARTCGRWPTAPFWNVNGNNVTVAYNHLSRYRVSTGEHVSRGETVGYVGTTGWSTSCHLHFTVMVNGDTVDPMGRNGD
jgi:hypothetical protein